MPKLSKVPLPIDFTAPPPLASISETQATLRVSRGTVNRMLKRGDLLAIKLGGATRISTASIRKLIDTSPARDAA